MVAAVAAASQLLLLLPLPLLLQAGACPSSKLATIITARICSLLQVLSFYHTFAAAAANAGFKSKLDDTVYSQPALFVTNLAALELLRGREPELVAAVSAAAAAGVRAVIVLFTARLCSYDKQI